jgi:hypothetical protein
MGTMREEVLEADWREVFLPESAIQLDMSRGLVSN